MRLDSTVTQEELHQWLQRQVTEASSPKHTADVLPDIEVLARALAAVAASTAWPDMPEVAP